MARTIRKTNLAEVWGVTSSTDGGNTLKVEAEGMTSRGTIVGVSLTLDYMDARNLVRAIQEHITERDRMTEG